MSAAGLTWLATVGDAQDISFGSAVHTITGATLGTGLFVFFHFDELGRTNVSCVIGGVTATLIAETTDHRCTMWQAAVNTPTGNIVLIKGAALGCVAGCGGLLTGANATATATAVHQTDSVGDPQTVTATVPASGIGIVGIGGNFIGIPTSWTSAIRDVVTEAGVATGNTAACAMAHNSTAGSQTPAATGGGGGNGWGFGGAGMIMACWGP